MTWRRIHIEGADEKHHKEWRARSYRIIWRDQIMGVHVTSGFQVCRRARLGDLEFNPTPDAWVFVDNSKHPRTLKGSKQLCEEHFKKDANE